MKALATCVVCGCIKPVDECAGWRTVGKGKPPFVQVSVCDGCQAAAEVR